MQTEYTPTEDDVTVEVIPPTGPPARGLVIAAQSHAEDARITVDFPMGDGPQLPVETTVTARFQGGALDSVREVTGQVVFRSCDWIRQRYQFLFPGAASRGLGPIVNQRGAIRVQPEAGKPIRMKLWAPEREEPYEAEVLDVSGRGLSIRVPQKVENALLTTWQVRIRLNLPDDLVPIELPVRIRYRQLVEGGVKYGIEFPTADSPGCHDHRERIYDWVMAKHAHDMSRYRPSPPQRRAS